MIITAKETCRWTVKFQKNLMMRLQVGRVELAGFSSFVTYQITQHHILEDSKLDINTSHDLPVTEH